MAGFVTLSADRRTLELDGNPFLFCGANCYYLMVSPSILQGPPPLSRGCSCGRLCLPSGETPPQPELHAVRCRREARTRAYGTR